MQQEDQKSVQGFCYSIKKGASKISNEQLNQNCIKKVPNLGLKFRLSGKDRKFEKNIPLKI
jgi:hypothetical protein